MGRRREKLNRRWCTISEISNHWKLLPLLDLEGQWRGGECSQNSSAGIQCLVGGCQSRAGTAEGMPVTNPDTGGSLVAARVSCAFSPSSLHECFAVGESISRRESGKCSSLQCRAEPGKQGERTLEQCLFSPQIKSKIKGK